MFIVNRTSISKPMFNSVVGVDALVGLTRPGPQSMTDTAGSATRV